LNVVSQPRKLIFDLSTKDFTSAEAHPEVPIGGDNG